MTPDGDSIAARIERAPARLGGVRLVAVDGPSGSGKSTVAAALVSRLSGAHVVSTDEFATWDDPVSWWPRLHTGVLVPFAMGRPGRYRRTRWVDGVPEPGEWVDIEPVRTLVLEGVSAGRRSIADVLSELVWCDLPDPAERLARAVRRDGESSRAELVRWQRFEAGWFAVDRTRSRASITVTV
ncbi:uridine kinase family protein [Actinokineospora enzanensis]|uniref:uridine kinase family protein n=1 Tax=Actinokineospora enzanensis TaxID=155975 RepID=UPI000372CC62|nr:(d)CMP kinase [Actinokineospora enzanensis]